MMILIIIIMPWKETSISYNNNNNNNNKFIYQKFIFLSKPSLINISSHSLQTANELELSLLAYLFQAYYLFKILKKNYKFYIP